MQTFLRVSIFYLYKNLFFKVSVKTIYHGHHIFLRNVYDFPKFTLLLSSFVFNYRLNIYLNLRFVFLTPTFFAFLVKFRSLSVGKYLGCSHNWELSPFISVAECEFQYNWGTVHFGTKLSLIKIYKHCSN